MTTALFIVAVIAAAAFAAVMWLNGLRWGAVACGVVAGAVFAVIIVPPSSYELRDDDTGEVSLQTRAEIFHNGGTVLLRELGPGDEFVSACVRCTAPWTFTRAVEEAAERGVKGRYLFADVTIDNRDRKSRAFLERMVAALGDENVVFAEPGTGVAKRMFLVRSADESTMFAGWVEGDANGTVILHRTRDPEIVRSLFRLFEERSASPEVHLDEEALRRKLQANLQPRL